jgi:methyl-accepting chemotaxis protein
MRLRRFTLIKNFSIVARLRVSNLLTLAGVGALWAVGHFALGEGSNDLNASNLLTHSVMLEQDSDMMHDALRADVLQARLTGALAPKYQQDAVREDVKRHGEAFRSNMAELEQLPLAENISKAVAEVVPLLDSYIAEATDMVNLAMTPNAEIDAEMLKFVDQFRAVEEKLGALGDVMVEQARSETLQAVAEIDKAQYNQNVISAATLGFLFIASFWTSRSITKPLLRIKQAILETVNGTYVSRSAKFERASDLNDEISEIAQHLEVLRGKLAIGDAAAMLADQRQRAQETVVAGLTVGLADLARGNLTSRITGEFTQDYAVLKADFNSTLDMLGGTIERVAGVSGQILDRASVIANGADDLSQRTASQAATLEQTAAALDQLTRSVKTTAENAGSVASIVGTVRQEAEESGRVVTSVVTAMHEIENSSSQIARIISVIDDIAFQTNLLALNAGVEAARAGDAGRGFAVVASEVRALAQRSSAASLEIRDLIGTSGQHVARGTVSVGEAGTVLDKLVGRVSEIAALVSNIAEQAREQSSGLAEVNIGVTQLDQLAQRNTQMVEETSSAAKALQRDAVDLEGLVSSFETENTTQARPIVRAQKHAFAA